MSGHSKWSTIKRAKGVQDQKRGKIFTRCIHEITVAVREGGGGDPDGNPRLRVAVDKAKAANMPIKTVERAIGRATGDIKGEEQFELTYEGYGPSGTAILVQVLTDNKNRTVSEIRHAFSKAGGSLGENGCVAWMFDKKGLFALKKDLISEEQLMESALDNGAEDISDEEDVWEIQCDPKDFHLLRTALDQAIGGGPDGKGYEFEVAEVQYLPKSRNSVSGAQAEKVVRLINALEDLDDVLSVAANCDIQGEADVEGATL